METEFDLDSVAIKLNKTCNGIMKYICVLIVIGKAVDSVNLTTPKFIIGIFI